MGSKEDKCYVVKTNCVAKKVNKSDCFTLRLGTLVYVEKVITNDLVAVRIDTSEKLISTSNEDYLWECPILNILPFDECMKPYILAVSSPLERVTLVQDEELCKTLSAFSVGSMVLVLPQKTLSSSKNQESSAIKEAIVKYKGPVHQMGVGTYFGIELLDPDPSDADTCDGTYSGCARYFSSPPGSGLFVAIHRLRPKPDSVAPRPPVIRSNKPVYHQPDASGDSPPFQICAVQKVRATFESMSQSSQLTSHTEKLIDLSPNRNHADVVDVPLKIGERVVWYRDSGQEHGVVRWLGHLEPSCIDLQAGIEFDNPVGKGTGLYNGKQLFEARKNHAFVLPVMALVKADDLYEHSSTSDLIKAKKKPSPISANLAGTDESCCMLSTMKTGRGMKPDQLYAPVKLKHPDSKWTCDIDGLDDHLCTNGSATSPVESKVFVNIDSTRKKGRKIENTPLESELNYGVNSTTTSHSNHAVGMKQMDKYSKGCDSVFVSSNIDISGRKCKINSKWAKVNNIDCDPSNLDGEWCGRSQQRPNRSKQDCEYKSVIGSNGKSVKVNNTIERSSHPNSSDIDLDILPSRSPSEHSVGGSDGYYDTPEPAHELQDLQNSPELPHVPYPDLGVGSVVEVFVKDEPLYGVIRWIGSVPEDKKARKLAGIEMEEERVGFSDGTFHGHRYFICNPRKALFVNLKECQKDGRFQEPPPSASADSKCKGFGQVDCPVIPGIVRPVAVSGDLQSKCGKFHGIQGHHNSCYLDATLFSMFTFTSVFDSLLYRPPTEKDCVQYEEVQQVLREEIVNPLRTNLFVRADRVMKLRTLLENHSSVSGLTSEEKDPEEFLNSLVAQILCADPFLKLSSGQEAYHYQLFVEKDEQLKLPSVQKLFEQSFLASDIKLKEVPSCLIIQMPRFGKSFKMYPRILPSQLLDVTDVIEDSPRQCTVCGKLAEFECKECMDHFDVGLENIAYCGPCLRTAHSHQRRAKHVWRQLKVPLEFEYIKDACSTLPRLYMELFAVVCIETSHYVAFVKCGSGSDAPWCFFDSMADRKGEQNGYNIPEMVPCPDLPYWLSDKGAQSLMDLDNRQLPEHAKRLLCDAYMCMYQSSDVMMYR